jgi:hypothetical protein
MYTQLKTILPAERFEELLSIGKEKSVLAADYFIKAGDTPLKIAYVFEGLFKFQSGKIATIFVSILCSSLSDPKTEIIISRARVQAFKAWMNGETA